MSRLEFDSTIPPPLSRCQDSNRLNTCMKYYTIYKVTNRIDGKIYIGSHKTENLNDNYMGSGKYLKRAIKKYGVENFKKEILFVFSTPEEMYAKEAELVNEDFLATANTYNLKIGGFGGWDYNNKYTWNDETRRIQNIKNSCFNDPEKFDSILKLGQERRRELWKTEEYRSKMTLHLKSICYTRGFAGKHHSEETKNKIGTANSISQSGNKNSQFGSIWITNGTENRKLKLSEQVPPNWIKGRTILKSK